jgi:hypothetical protein
MRENATCAARAVVIDHDVISRCIREPSRYAPHIGALMDISMRDDTKVYGCEGWMAYLSQLMVSARYYYLLKDYRFTRRLKTQEVPSYTLHFIEQLYNATTVRGVRLPAGVNAGLAECQCRVAQDVGGTLLGMRLPALQETRWCNPESWAKQF